MKYQRIVFMQGEEADEPLRILDEQGEESAMDYLAEWDMDPPDELYDEPAGGTDDYTYEDDNGFVLTWNIRLGYIGLERKVDE